MDQWQTYQQDEWARSANPNLHKIDGPLEMAHPERD